MNSLNDKTVSLISLRGIDLSREGRSIIRGVSLDVNQGDFIAITGPNGGGKTTLLRVMLKLLKPDRGSVTYIQNGNHDLRIGYLPQKNMIDSHFPISVKEVIGSGLLGIKGISKEHKKDLIASTLDLVGMTDHAERPIGMLSGGQLQRSLMGRAIISRPEVLVLDEPLSYIDKNFESHFYQIISTLKTDTTIVLVSHEMTAIAEMANRHLIVDHTIHECTAHHHYVISECR